MTFQERYRQLFRLFRSIMLGMTIGIGVSLVLLVWFLHANQDFITGKALELLRRNTTISLQQEQVHLSLWEHFPHVSIVASDVVIPESDGNAFSDTLLSADKLYLKVDLVPLLFRHIQVNRVMLNKATINIRRDNSGRLNFQDIFLDNREKGDETSANTSEIEIEQLELREVYCSYYQVSNGFSVSQFIDKGTLSFAWVKQQLALSVDLDGELRELDSGKLKVEQHLPFRCEGKLTEIDERWQMHETEFMLDGIQVLVTGLLKETVPPDYEIVFTGKRIAINKASKLLNLFGVKLPDHVAVKKGRMSVQGRMESGEGDLPVQLTIDFNAEKLSVDLAEKKINEGDFSGRFSLSGERYALSIERADFKSMKGRFSGNLHFSKGVSSNISIALEGDVPLSTLIAAGKLQNQLQGSGLVYVNYYYDGVIPDEVKAFLLAPHAQVLLSLNQNDLTIQGHKPINFTALSGKIVKQATIKLDSIGGKIHGSDFVLAANIINPGRMLGTTTGRNASLSGHLYVDSLQAEWFMPENEAEAESIGRKTHEGIFPKHMEGQVSVDLNTFTKGRFVARQVKGKVRYRPYMFTLNGVELKTADGKVQAGGVLMKKFHGDYAFRGQCRFSDVSIHQLFLGLNNFGQDYIRAEHLGGKLSGTMYIQTNLSSVAKMDLPSLEVKSDIRIESGELIDFEPMMALSRFIDIQELEHIRFSTLENQITIKDQLITFPQMDINSSAFNVSGSGKHHFSSPFDYHLKVLLSDVFSSRIKKQKHSEASFGAIKDDGLGNTALYLQIEGDSSDFKVRYDRTQARKVLKQKVKKEKQDLKRILNEEFGWFKKDTLTDSVTESQHQVAFDENAAVKKKKPKKTRTEEKPRFQIVFDEDTVKAKEK